MSQTLSLISTLPVTAVLVSFNTKDMTLRALQQLLEDPAGGPVRTIVVDNASTDGSAAAVQAAFPEVVVIENLDNPGFGAANNLGMAAGLSDVAADFDFFLLINTDAFVHAGAVTALADRLRREPGLAVVGPQLWNADGSLQRSCYGFPTPGLAWLENLGLGRLARGNRTHHSRAGRVDFVSGACMMVRRSAYEAVGGFDEAFFMYSEETDWQRRLTDAGWGIGYEPAAEVTHLGGGSQTPGRVNPEFFRSIDRYQRKHHGVVGMWSFRAAMLVGAALRLPARLLLATRGPRQKHKLAVNWFVLRRLLVGEGSPLAAISGLGVGGRK